ncbi:MFS transporter [Cellulomonas chitinilytica]|uniref:MFS transporter n=1 Tax=Cellulomonas chitinilytica TaxID=398759 RepID=A0A919U0Q9_9CELL|nr:MFS transporter [Cellulomonas chitinilytica]GIG22253.1 MFS transporter [Cellulomonas chitinilytica]
MTRRPAPAVHLGLLVALVVTFLAASAAPTPLYATYAAAWHIGPLGVTVAFGVYAVAVLVALLVLGRLSDHLGRRPVLVAGTVGQILAVVLLATADGYDALLVARVVQGLATGAAVGALGAAMLDVDRGRGALTNSVATGAGTATGALASGLVVQYLPAPTHTIYVAVLALLVLELVGLLLVPETAPRTPGARARAAGSLRPDVRMPAAVRGPLLGTAPVVFAVWALAGLYGALGPAVLHALTDSSSVLLGGLALATLAGVAAVAGALLRDVAPHRVMLVSVGAVALGVLTTLVAVSTGSTVGFFAGTAVAGLGFGAGFQGAVRTVVPKARPEERAGVLSVLYIVAYLGMGVPAVVAGALVGRVGDLTTVVRDYGVVVLALVGVALVALLRSRPRAAAPSELIAPPSEGVAPLPVEAVEPVSLGGR